MDISVVVCTYNRKELLQNALDSIIRQETNKKFTFEIVIVDDGSTDGTENVIKHIIKRTTEIPICYVQMEVRGGIAGTKNEGIRKASGNWIAFCDDDQWAEPNWLAELYRIAIEKEADCVAGGVALDFPGVVEVELSAYCRSLLSEKVLSEGQADIKNLAAGGGNLIIHRKVFTLAGEFDTRMEIGEDSDFFWRALKLGVVMWYAPKAIVHHIIPEARLTYDNFKRKSMAVGRTNALIRYKYAGRLRWLLTFVKWSFRAVGRDVWLLLLAHFIRNLPQQLDRRCRIWISMGYLSGSMAILVNRLFKQKSFLH